MECECVGDGKYSSVVIVPAAVLHRTNGVEPHEIEVDVHLSDGELCKGEVLACDFHFNLAALKIQSKSMVKPPVFRGLDDTSSIHLNEVEERKFPLTPHSALFKVHHGSKIVTLQRSSKPPYELFVDSGCFCTHDFSSRFDCKEIYWLKHDNQHLGHCGGPVINLSGEVIGINCVGSSFLPTNLVSRWWDHFKICREYHRPYLGLETANLYSARVDFLEQFSRNFPSNGTGVIVTKVEKDSPAYRSGIRSKDVIIECHGELIRSKLEFLERTWDKSLKSMELIILRADNNEQLNLVMTIDETTPDKFYRWPCASWSLIKKTS